MMKARETFKIVFYLIILAAIVLTGCKPISEKESPSEAEGPTEQSGEEVESPAEEAFDLDALIAAAQEEGELIAYCGSSRVIAAGEVFTELYGITVEGTKMKDYEQNERIVRMVDSGNVQVDVTMGDSGPRYEMELIPEGYMHSWFPPDLVDVIPEKYQDPVRFLWQPRIFGYNTEVYGDGCPVSNMWQLTDEEWSGKVVMQDPQVTSAQLDMFVDLVAHPEPLAQAYQEYYGEPLETDEKNAGWEFLKRLAENNPVIMDSDTKVADAVGGAGQTDPPIGLYSFTKHRDIEEKDLKLGACHSMEPYMGYTYPMYALIVEGAPHPNAAKLFIHCLLEGPCIEPWALDDIGGFSTNPNVGSHPDNDYLSLSEWVDRTVTWQNQDAWELEREVLDFWLLHGQN
ncbi:MAG: ABC transporter substrate-binding protein [Syntrophaceae bacterium]|nr:ABC transporter substrate-binding protein [Syntrophaceae bacterium]